ncbi:polysaccharide deacetylase family protein [Desulfoscipio gibsoniae]
MSSSSLRVATGIMFLLGVCFCWFFYPTHAKAPSNLPEDQAGADISQQPNTPDKTTLPVNREPQAPVKPQQQSDDKNIGKQTPSSGAGQNASVTQNEPLDAAHENPESTTKPNEGLTPQPPAASPAKPVSGSTDQLIKRVDGIDNMVAITFDDGPFPKMTEQYLAVLDKLNAKATFFMVGQRIKYYPELARQVVEQGSEIGSHSWQHAHLDQLTKDAIIKDLNDVADQVQDTVGRKISLLRPPYGGRSDNLLAAARQLGYKVIIWDVDPRDWEDPLPEKIVAGVLEQVKPGSIIVMHEGHPNTLQALPDLIQKLRERGLEPVLVSEMLNQVQSQPENSLATDSTQ